VSLMRSRSMRRSPSGTCTVYSSGFGSTSGFVGGTLGAGRDASCSAAACAACCAGVATAGAASPSSPALNSATCSALRGRPAAGRLTEGAMLCDQRYLHEDGLHPRVDWTNGEYRTLCS